MRCRRQAMKERMGMSILVANEREVSQNNEEGATRNNKRTKPLHKTLHGEEGSVSALECILRFACPSMTRHHANTLQRAPASRALERSQGKAKRVCDEPRSPTTRKKQGQTTTTTKADSPIHVPRAV
jgi:hypothetical protein